MVLIVVVFYFILLRPQQQRAKQQRKMLETIKAGDKVVTSSGIVGVVITVKERTIALRSGDAKFEVTKASVTEVLDASTTTES
jgi:preprotein translocase subunit YajC